MFNMANVQRAYCAQNDVCSDRDESLSLSLGTQIQYAQPLLSQAKRQPGSLNRLFPVRRCRIMPNRFIIMCPKRRAMWYGKPKVPTSHHAKRVVE
jgi:hypothetical protein